MCGAGACKLARDEAETHPGLRGTPDLLCDLQRLHLEGQPSETGQGLSHREERVLEEQVSRLVAAWRLSPSWERLVERGLPRGSTRPRAEGAASCHQLAASEDG